MRLKQAESQKPANNFFTDLDSSVAVLLRYYGLLFTNIEPRFNKRPAENYSRVKS